MVKGREALRNAARLCPTAKLEDDADVLALREWLASSWDYMVRG